MRRAEEPRRPCSRTLDSSLAESDVPANIERGLEVQLAVKVSVIADLMALVRHTTHKLRPALSMRTEDEERGANPLISKRIENLRRCVGIRPVIERQRNLADVSGQMPEHAPKHHAITVKRAVRDATQQRHTDGSGGEDHTVTLLCPNAEA